MPSYDALLAGAGSGGVVHKGKEAMEGMKAFEGEQKVGRERKKKLQEWDRLLKDFRYGDALDSVMRKVSSFVLLLLLHSGLPNRCFTSPLHQQRPSPSSRS